MKRVSGLATVPVAICAALTLSAATAQEKAYKVGYIADLSGPMQDNYGPIVEGFEYLVKEINARGGINGVPGQVVGT